MTDTAALDADRTARDGEWHCRVLRLRACPSSAPDCSSGEFPGRGELSPLRVVVRLRRHSLHRLVASTASAPSTHRRRGRTTSRPRTPTSRRRLPTTNVSRTASARSRRTSSNDRNGNGSRAATGEEGLSGWRIFIDTNGNSSYESGTDISPALTDSNGEVVFSKRTPATYQVCEVGQAPGVGKHGPGRWLSLQERDGRRRHPDSRGAGQPDP